MDRVVAAHLARRAQEAGAGAYVGWLAGWVGWLVGWLVGWVCPVRSSVHANMERDDDPRATCIRIPHTQTGGKGGGGDAASLARGGDLLSMLLAESERDPKGFTPKVCWSVCAWVGGGRGRGIVLLWVRRNDTRPSPLPHFSHAQ